MIRVAIVASGMAMRVGLRQIVSSLPDLTVVAETTHVTDLPPAEVLILTSIALLPRVSEEDSPAILLLSDEPSDAPQLAKFPLWGILPLETSESELDAAIRALSEGLCVGAPSLLGELLARPVVFDRENADLSIEILTGRELEILQLTTEGLANKQIALSLSISEHTVKFHLSSIYAKLGVTSRTEAVRAGARRGLVTL